MKIQILKGIKKKLFQILNVYLYYVKEKKRYSNKFRNKIK